MHHFTDTQLAALRAARDGGGLRKTGNYWHARAYIIDPESYGPDRRSVFSTETIEALHTHGMLDGGARITPEGLAVLAASKRAVLKDIEEAFAVGARNALAARRR